jgi:hypothetical protein
VEVPVKMMGDVNSVIKNVIERFLDDEIQYQELYEESAPKEQS